jgi:hypothetical protein
MILILKIVQKIILQKKKIICKLNIKKMLVSVIYSKLIFGFLLSNTNTQVFKLISIKI